LHAEAGRSPPIFGLHIHNRLTLNLSINEALAKRDSMNIGFLLRRIHGIS